MFFPVKIKDIKFNWVKEKSNSCKSTKTAISTSDNQKFCFGKGYGEKIFTENCSGKVDLQKRFLHLANRSNLKERRVKPPFVVMSIASLSRTRYFKSVASNRV